MRERSVAVGATIDEALEMLSDTGPEWGYGELQALSNHGPMGAEALCALGRDEAVVPWVERYKRRLQGHPEPRNPISREEWREALGDGGRIGDWIAFFDRELDEAMWQNVLNQWVPRLASGFIAAATHGAIRTGHAVRSLAADETTPRKHELAEGLAYWAARYVQLPGAPASSGESLPPSQAIGHVKPLPPDERENFGLITDTLRRLDNYPPFDGVADLVDTSGDASHFVADLTETFAHVYLANASEGDVIGLIHCVTGPSAIRLLAPQLAPETRAMLLRYGWQAAAALYVALAHEPGGGEIEQPAGTIDDLIDRSVATKDEHAIKFTEACLREYALNPKPVYLAAAADATGRLAARQR